MNAKHQSTVPAVAAEYFARYVGEGHPTIDQCFTPGFGWMRSGWKRKNVSTSACRKLKAEGVTSVALSLDRRRADFAITELCKRG